jgi:hypothetical protein
MLCPTDVYRASARAPKALVMGRNALGPFGQNSTGRRMADIAQTENADHPLALVNHRQSADLQRLHVPHGLGEVIIITATMDAWCHHITSRRAVGIEIVLRQTFADNVSVGHHTNETVVLSDRNSANIVRSHINFASSATGVSGLTQSTPLCIASLTFMEDLREFGCIDEMHRWSPTHHFNI